MILKRKESWGVITYDSVAHGFTVHTNKSCASVPYVTSPIVLNVDLTFRCNMNCRYCVAKDTSKLLGQTVSNDLRVTKKLITQINASDFLLIVITGGEPFLPEVQPLLEILLSQLHHKGIVVDTNGTLIPPDRIIRLLLKKRAMVRVSWDSPRVRAETFFRRYGTLFKSDKAYIDRKEQMIGLLSRAGIQVAVQTVVHGLNYSDPNFLKFPYQLEKLGISKWYLQRIIPSNEVLSDTRRKKLLVTFSEYSDCLSRILPHAQRCGVECISKLDRRHNSVFLLVGNGEVYTQSDDSPGKKLYLGSIGSFKDYFDYVSSADHSSRYYSSS